MNNILDLNLEMLKKWMIENKESAFRAKQIMDFIYNNVWDFEQMTNIPKGLREKLKQQFYVGVPKVITHLVSKMDETHKVLLEYNDGNLIEAVVMKYKHGNTICISSQVGCRMGCKFCASTVNGMVRNLTSGEMIGEILAAQSMMNDRISNIVIMGSGEPLDNFDNIIDFLEVVGAEYGLNIGKRHITLSTCGIVPKILELADKNYQITLAISLHAPNDEIRRQMMPIANKYSINEVIKACKHYINITNRRITFEYALVRDVNDKKEHAEELALLLKDMLCHVNLIPVNEIKERNFSKPPMENVKKFVDILKANGIETTVRREMGADINAACGQLRRSYIESKH